MFRDKINLRLQKGGSVKPPRTPPPVYGPALNKMLGCEQTEQEQLYY